MQLFSIITILKVELKMNFYASVSALPADFLPVTMAF